MQLFSQELELKCIRTLTSSKIPERVRSTLLGKLTKEFFNYTPAQAAFVRIDTLARKRFTIIGRSDLLSDPALSEDFRDILRDDDSTHCTSYKSIQSMLGTLEKYRKLRVLHALAVDVLNKMEEESVDVEKLLNQSTDSIAHARRDLDTEDQVVIIGENGNANDLVHDVLHKVSEELIKTGFSKYDNINGGVPKEGVMLLASTTSGGKSTMLLNLMRNMYENEHKRVCRVSLEMGDRQEMSRLLSNISGISFTKIKQHKLSPKEKQKIKSAYETFNTVGIEHKCVFNTVSPTKSMTIDDTLRMVKPYRYDVIGIDYVSLLEEENRKDQWKNLNDIVKVCKIFSRENKCLVIVLCQLDDESDRLRYSKGMKEHADVMWSWNYSKKEQRELRVLPIRTDKARDAELLSFDLAERFNVMKITNMDDDGYDADDPDSEVVESNDMRLKTDEDDYALS